MEEWDDTLSQEQGLFIMNKNLRQKAQEAASTHRDSLIKSLQHRLEVARTNGDEALIRQLEAEASYLHLK